MENTPNLDYLNEVTKEHVEGFYFVDYIDTKSCSWIRCPFQDINDVALSGLRAKQNGCKRYRVTPMVELIEPINRDGFTEDEFRWDAPEDAEFIPVAQKVEAMFDSRYRITKEFMEFYLGDISAWW